MSTRWMNQFHYGCRNPCSIQACQNRAVPHQLQNIVGELEVSAAGRQSDDSVFRADNGVYLRK